MSKQQRSIPHDVIRPLRNSDAYSESNSEAYIPLRDRLVDSTPAGRPMIEDGFATITRPSANGGQMQYVGYMVGCRRHGLGRQWVTNGRSGEVCIFEGIWFDDILSGPGKFISTDGTNSYECEGTFVNGTLEGEGIYSVRETGRRYAVVFRNGSVVSWMARLDEDHVEPGLPSASSIPSPSELRSPSNLRQMHTEISSTTSTEEVIHESKSTSIALNVHYPRDLRARSLVKAPQLFEELDKLGRGSGFSFSYDIKIPDSTIPGSIDPEFFTGCTNVDQN